MGGTDQFTNKWVWTDGTPFGYTNWITGEPNNGNGHNREDCLGLKITALPTVKREAWKDGSCDNKAKFMCKIMFSQISFS